MRLMPTYQTKRIVKLLLVHWITRINHMANPQTGNGFTKIAKPEIIETLSREGVELRQRGRISWACCPLHQERTPSFCVDREKQRFKCFGCGVGGDVVDFGMKHKGL